MLRTIHLKEKRSLWRAGLLTLGSFFLSIFVSCAGSNGNPPLLLSDKIPHTVAVVFAEEFILAGGDHYSISQALHAELFDCVGNVYQNTVEELEIPAKGEYDRIIKFTLNEIIRDEHNRRLVNATDPSLPSRYIPLRFRISVTMASYEGENVGLINTKVVKGVGESASQEGISIREGAAIASSSDRGSLDKAVAEALESVCNNVTKLLMQGFAEPEKKSKTS
jgi:hypothetical protein